MSLTEPISDSEYVLRRVPVSRVNLSATAQPIHRDAFGPTPQDASGLSVYLESTYAGNPAGILADVPEEKRGNYYVVRVNVATLKSLGLSVTPEPAALPGHAVIPELRREAREANRTWANEIQARMAAASEIVHTPPQPS